MMEHGNEVRRHADGLLRCPWCGDDPDYIAYHDMEWGVPVHDEHTHFAFLVLEGFQAGLSWLTVLKKRPRFETVFDGFDPERVARYDEAKIAELLADRGIIRNRAKIHAAVTNARACLEVQREFGSFDRYIWSFVGDEPVQNAWRSLEEVPGSTELSDRVSADLKQRGFRFVGSTIVYAHLQATGIVNDHLVDCFRYAELAPGSVWPT
jgi:DNA-3-methyladenine glycosylase I